MTSGVVKYGYKESVPGNCTVMRARLVGLKIEKMSIFMQKNKFDQS